MQQVKEEIPDDSTSCDTAQQEHNPTLCIHNPADYNRQAQSVRGPSLHSLQLLTPKLENNEHKVKIEVGDSTSTQSEIYSYPNHASPVFVKFEETEINMEENREKGNVDVIIKEERDTLSWRDSVSTLSTVEQGGTRQPLYLCMRPMVVPNQLSQFCTVRPTVNGDIPLTNKVDTKEHKNPEKVSENKDKLPKVMLKLVQFKVKTGDNGDVKQNFITQKVPKLFACPRCDYKSKQESDVLKHMNRHTEEKTFTCNVCDYTCGKKSYLKRHMLRHTGDKPFACHFCDYKTIQRNHLNGHLRTHTGEKPFICTICGYKCSLKQTLKTHMRTHTGEKPFACDICAFRCKQFGQLRIHTRTHTGEKPFACVMCEYRCSNKNALTTHYKVHADVRPLACDMCDYKCRVRSHLDIHKRRHTGERPFACDLCEYKCNSKGKLTRHMGKHTGGKPFACHFDSCGYRDSHKRGLLEHVKTHASCDNRGINSVTV